MNSDGWCRGDLDYLAYVDERMNPEPRDEALTVETEIPTDLQLLEEHDDVVR